MTKQLTGPAQAEIVLHRDELPAMQEPSVGSMLQQVIAAGITADSVGVLERMMGMYERNEDRQAKKDFAAALVALQGDTSRISATRIVNGRDGELRYKFAAFEDIMAEVQPKATAHGFCITFDTETGDDRLTSICTLTHSSGHSRSNRFAAKYSTPPGATNTQGDMSTKSYAKRGALCDALNIVIDKDDDGNGGDDHRAIGECVTAEQAAILRELCEATGSDSAAFLAYAGRAKTFEEIASSRFEKLHFKLKEKEAKL